MTEQEERLLISKVLLYNDHSAFENLLSAHQNGIKNLLIKLLNFNDADLDDIFQETCTKIYKNLKQYNGSASFSTWIYRITYNTFLNAYKRKGKLHREQGPLQIEKSIRPDIQHDMKMDMERMIMILRPEEKAAIQLSYIMGFSHQDIAVIMDCPLGSIKSLIKRGKERIARNYKNYQ